MIWALLATSLAGPVTVGVGTGVAIDLPDRASRGTTAFGPGPLLEVPVTWEVTDFARLRVATAVHLAWGHDRVTWSEEVDGAPARFYDQSHWTMLTLASLRLGAEVLFPTGKKIRPLLGGEGGPAWVGTYHSFGGDTQVLLDPAQNKLDRKGNVDPYTSQLTWCGGLHLGLIAPVGSKLDLWVQTGYSVAFVEGRPLRKAPPALDAQREPYGWNALRATVGLSYAFRRDAVP